MLLTCLAGSQLAVALYDPEDRLQFANTAFRSAFVVDAQAYPTWPDLMRHCFSQRTGLLIETEDIEAWIADISTRRRQGPSRTFECDLTDGRWLRMTETMVDGWMLCIATDITSIKDTEHYLRQARDSAIHAAQTDPLTGVYNRRFIFARLDEALEHACITNAPLALAVLDLDYFKQINDTYGHPAGDRILQHFVKVAQQNLRPTDLLGRIGGEEFLLLLTGTSLSDAASAIDRFQRAMGMTSPLPERPEMQCTFSVGLTDACATDNVTRLFHRADKALYAAKQGGRNRQFAISGQEN